MVGMRKPFKLSPPRLVAEDGEERWHHGLSVLSYGDGFFIFDTLKKVNKKRVLSGIRASGRLHLGNYLGAVKGMLALQDSPDYDTFYMVADLHTLTTPYDPKILKDDVREVVLDYLAAGLDPSKSALFVQSRVPEHIELSYLFSTSVSLAKMLHLPTYKEKLKLHPHDSTVALLYYPVLMAADILVYKAELVPVGIDQEPNLEVAREIARKMNSVYSTSFPEPKRFATEGEYIPSLTGEGKMSKSVEGSYINLTDDLETIKAKLAKAPTDSGKGEKIPEEGGVSALLKFVELFEGKEKRQKYEKEYTLSAIKYSQLKEELAEAIFEELKPIQEKRKKFETDPELVEKILEDGAKRAREVATEVVSETKKAMGLI
jgi:tryptophanyl-tRNA synthetase